MSHSVGGSLRSIELDGDYSEKGCCVTERWWSAKLIQQEVDGVGGSYAYDFSLLGPAVLFILRFDY